MNPSCSGIVIGRRALKRLLKESSSFTKEKQKLFSGSEFNNDSFLDNCSIKHAYGGLYGEFYSKPDCQDDEDAYLTTCSYEQIYGKVE